MPVAILGNLNTPVKKNLLHYGTPTPWSLISDTVFIPILLLEAEESRSGCIPRYLLGKAELVTSLTLNCHTSDFRIIGDRIGFTCQISSGMDHFCAIKSLVDKEGTSV